MRGGSLPGLRAARRCSDSASESQSSSGLQVTAPGERRGRVRLRLARIRRFTGCHSLIYRNDWD